MSDILSFGALLFAGVTAAGWLVMVVVLHRCGSEEDEE